MTALLYTYFTSAITDLATYIEHERFIRRLIMIKTNKKTDQLTRTTVRIFLPQITVHISPLLILFKLNEQTKRNETLTFNLPQHSKPAVTYFSLKNELFTVTFQSVTVKASVSRPARANVKLPQSFCTLASSLANLPIISRLRDNVHQNVRTM